MKKKVTFDNNDSLVTEINTDLTGATKYYLGRTFNIGRVAKCISVLEVI